MSKVKQGAHGTATAKGGLGKTTVAALTDATVVDNAFAAAIAVAFSDTDVAAILNDIYVGVSGLDAP